MIKEKQRCQLSHINLLHRLPGINTLLVLVCPSNFACCEENGISPLYDAMEKSFSKVFGNQNHILSATEQHSISHTLGRCWWWTNMSPSYHEKQDEGERSAQGACTGVCTDHVNKICTTFYNCVAPSKRLPLGKADVSAE